MYRIPLNARNFWIRHYTLHTQNNKKGKKRKRTKNKQKKTTGMLLLLLVFTFSRLIFNLACGR